MTITNLCKLYQCLFSLCVDLAVSNSHQWTLTLLIIIDELVAIQPFHQEQLETMTKDKEMPV